MEEKAWSILSRDVNQRGGGVPNRKNPFHTCILCFRPGAVHFSLCERLKLQRLWQKQDKASSLFFRSETLPLPYLDRHWRHSPDTYTWSVPTCLHHTQSHLSIHPELHTAVHSVPQTVTQCKRGWVCTGSCRLRSLTQSPAAPPAPDQPTGRDTVFTCGLITEHKRKREGGLYHKRRFLPKWA